MGLLIENGLTLSVSESCTGGLISSYITDIPGASGCFIGGFIVYSNKLKKDILGVDDRTLEDHGAVSYQCAYEMVRGTIDFTKTDLALSVTGIAGPIGGSEEKPVGTVFIGSQRKGLEIDVREFNLKGLKRVEFKEEVTRRSLELLMGLISETGS